MIAIQLVIHTCVNFDQIQRLKDLHSLSFVHNDIKLENILIGSENPGNIFLIDFGLSSQFNSKDNSNRNIHHEKKKLGVFSGNFMFSSRGSCKGYSKSRRDDVESVFYLLVFLMNKNLLPWSSINMSSSLSFS